MHIGDKECDILVIISQHNIRCAKKKQSKSLDRSLFVYIA